MTKTLALLIALAAPASALELTLEENRAERGSVGYVDMARLFAASPDTQRAKENFEELVRQAEEEVNARRAALARLRQEADALKAERETLLKSTPVAPSPAPAPAKAAPAVPEPAKPASRVAPALPGFDSPGSTSAAVSVTAAPPPSVDSPGAEAGRLAPPSADGPPAPVPAAPSQPAPAPAAEQAPRPAADAAASRLIELDGLIAARQAEIAPLEAALERERASAERNLLDAESRRADQVLARLYRAVSEVARRDGVSVVVDKSAILYGHPAVDLTDRVLAHLRGPKQ